MEEWRIWVYLRGIWVEAIGVLSCVVEEWRWRRMLWGRELELVPASSTPSILVFFWSSSPQSAPSSTRHHSLYHLHKTRLIPFPPIIFSKIELDRIFHPPFAFTNRMTIFRGEGFGLPQFLSDPDEALPFCHNPSRHGGRGGWEGPQLSQEALNLFFIFELQSGLGHGCCLPPHIRTNLRPGNGRMG